MKTAEEILDGFEKFNADLGGVDDIHVCVTREDALKSIKQYAEQIISALASKSEEMIRELPKEEDTEGLVVRKWQTCYAVSKQIILKVKDGLK